MQSFWSVAQDHRFNRASAQKGRSSCRRHLPLLPGPRLSSSHQSPDTLPGQARLLSFFWPAAIALLLGDTCLSLGRAFFPGPCHSSLAPRLPIASPPFPASTSFGQLQINGSHKAVAVGAAVPELEGTCTGKHACTPSLPCSGDCRPPLTTVVRGLRAGELAFMQRACSEQLAPH